MMDSRIAAATPSAACEESTALKVATESPSSGASAILEADPAASPALITNCEEGREGRKGGEGGV
jgi:hypothetical protein